MLYHAERLIIRTGLADRLHIRCFFGSSAEYLVVIDSVGDIHLPADHHAVVVCAVLQLGRSYRYAERSVLFDRFLCHDIGFIAECSLAAVIIAGDYIIHVRLLGREALMNERCFCSIACELIFFASVGRAVYIVSCRLIGLFPFDGDRIGGSARSFDSYRCRFGGSDDRDLGLILLTACNDTCDDRCTGVHTDYITLAVYSRGFLIS